MVEPTVLMTGIDGAESTSLITMNGNTIVEALKNEEEGAERWNDEHMFAITRYAIVIMYRHI